jgi:plastocyanin
MRRILVSAGGAAAIAVVSFACGGGSGPSGPSNNPPQNNPQATTINIVGDNGRQSFTPNPADNNVNRATWRNTDSQVHRIVANDGSFDTGNINPGASSSAVSVSADGANYHCTLHPGMVGTIRAASGTEPPCTGFYC